MISTPVLIVPPALLSISSIMILAIIVRNQPDCGRRILQKAGVPDAFHLSDRTGRSVQLLPAHIHHVIEFRIPQAYAWERMQIRLSLLRQRQPFPISFQRTERIFRIKIQVKKISPGKILLSIIHSFSIGIPRAQLQQRIIFLFLSPYLKLHIFCEFRIGQTAKDHRAHAPPL